MNKIEFFLTALQAYSAKVDVQNTELIACLDLTALNTTDTAESIKHLAKLAQQHQVAAVCVSLAFVELAVKSFRGPIATVVNFPSGSDSLTNVLASIDHALAVGATEIDVVVPYQQFLIDNNAAVISKFVSACKAVCGPNIKLKAIVESGLVADPHCLERLCLAALEGGANFLKTSTGKVTSGATLTAAVVLLGALKSFGEPSCGFKAAGGVKTAQQAKHYWLLAKLMMGDAWPNPQHFRMGASTLLEDLLAQPKAF